MYSMHKELDILFLDLEATVIESWEVPVLVNISKITQILHKLSPRKIGIFSFAIWSDDDLHTFNRIIRPNIERELCISISDDLIPTKRSIHKKIKEEGKEVFLAKDFISFDDFTELWSKDRAFIDWCRASFTDKRIILLDDIVTTCKLEFPDLTIEMIKM